MGGIPERRCVGRWGVDQTGPGWQQADANEAVGPGSYRETYQAPPLGPPGAPIPGPWHIRPPGALGIPGHLHPPSLEGWIDFTVRGLPLLASYLKNHSWFAQDREHHPRLHHRSLSLLWLGMPARGTLWPPPPQPHPLPQQTTGAPGPSLQRWLQKESEESSRRPRVTGWLLHPQSPGFHP